MTKEDNKDFKKTTKCWICDNDYIDNDIKVKDQRGSAHGECNINLTLNHKIPVIFYKLENYDSHLILQ